MRKILIILNIRGLDTCILKLFEPTFISVTVSVCHTQKQNILLTLMLLHRYISELLPFGYDV